MERVDNAVAVSVRLFAAGPFVPGGSVSLDEDAAHHLRVRRIAPDHPVALHDGAGTIARGSLSELTKGRAVVRVDTLDRVPRLPGVHLMAPVGDRDRMLWLAEKATELGVTSWRAVRWRRSLSVGPRGEGDGFRAKVVARMRSALEQSGGAWLPDVLPELGPAEAAALVPGGGDGGRYLLTAGAPGMLGGALRAPVTIVLGPEGGIADDEEALFLQAGYRPVSVGPNVLRFETAGVAALALARAGLDLAHQETIK